MFHISTSTVRQMTAGCTVCGLTIANTVQPLTAGSLSTSIGSPQVPSPLPPSKPLDGQNFLKQTGTLLSPNYFGIGLNHPEDGSSYVLPKYRNTPSIGQETQTQATGVTRPRNTAQEQDCDVLQVPCWLVRTMKLQQECNVCFLKILHCYAYYIYTFVCFGGRQPPADRGLLIHEVSG